MSEWLLEEGTMSPKGLKWQDPCMWALTLWVRHMEGKARSCPVWTLLKSHDQRWSYKPQHGEEVAGGTGYSGDPCLYMVFLWRFCFKAFKKVRKLVSLFITPYSVTDLKDTYEEYMCIQYICLCVPLTYKQLAGFRTHRPFTMETHCFIDFLGAEASQVSTPDSPTYLLGN